MGFIHSQLVATRRLPVPSGSYAGKTVVITGSNTGTYHRASSFLSPVRMVSSPNMANNETKTGIGKEAAKWYARLGASRLILAVRGTDKGEAAKRDIIAAACSPPRDSDNPPDIQVWSLDMSSYASIQAFAARLSGPEVDRVDVFLANAGVTLNGYTTAEDCETMITVNFVGTFLLVALVLPVMKATAARTGARPTITLTSSGAHRFTKFPQQEAPRGEILATCSDRAFAEKNWGSQYPVSKILGIFALRAIGERYPQSAVTINCVDPGLCKSEFGRDMKGVQKAVFPIVMAALARTSEEGRWVF